MTYFPLFHQLWFLWFLSLLILVFAAYAWFAKLIRFKGLPNWLICSPVSLFILVPLTMVPVAFMDPAVFGPDTSVGLLPMPSVLLYYSLFFFFGAVYWDSDDQAGRLGRGWIAYLLVSLLIVLPVAINVNDGAIEYFRQNDSARTVVFNFPAIAVRMADGFRNSWVVSICRFYRKSNDAVLV